MTKLREAVKRRATAAASDPAPTCATCGYGCHRGQERRLRDVLVCRACACPSCRPATKGGFEEALDDYLRAEHELSLQFSLDGMDQGGPLKFKAKAKRTALLAAHAAAVEAAVAKEREECAAIADDHECGDRDDIICNHQNCGMLIAAAIRGRKP